METMYIAFSILFLMCAVVANPPSNDHACNATLIYIGDSVVANLTDEATKQNGEISPGPDALAAYNGYGQDGWYNADTAVQNSIWYRITAFELELKMVEHAGNCLDTQLAVYTVADCADFSTFTLIKANDNGWQFCYNGAHILPFTECATQEYYIQVDSFNYGDAIITGSFQMEVAGMEEGECPPMTNDNVCDATQIAVGDVVIDVLTQSGTNQTNEIRPNIIDCYGQSGWCWDDPNVQNSLWYKVTASELELEMVSYSGVRINTQLAVYTATDCGDFSTFTLVKANDDQSYETLTAHILPFNGSNNGTQCVDYYIQVDGGAAPGRPEGIATGFFQMNVIGACDCNSCTSAPSYMPSTAPTTSSESSESSDSEMSDSNSQDSDERKKKKKKKQKEKSSSDSVEYALFGNNEFDETEMNMPSMTKRVILQFSDFTVMNVWLLFGVILAINLILVCVWYTTRK